MYIVYGPPPHYYTHLTASFPSIRHASFEPGTLNVHFSTALQWTHTCGIILSLPHTYAVLQTLATFRCLQWPNC